MEFRWMDFLIGLLIANAIPHFVVAVTEVRFRGLFGFGSKQNILYSLWNLAWAIGLSLYFYGLDGVLKNGLFLGICAILFSYYIGGRFLYLLWNKKI